MRFSFFLFLINFFIFESVICMQQKLPSELCVYLATESNTNNSIKAIDEYLSNGGQLYDISIDNATMIYYAIKYDKFEIVEYLIKQKNFELKKAKFNESDNRWVHCIEFIFLQKNMKIIKLIIDAMNAEDIYAGFFNQSDFWVYILLLNNKTILNWLLDKSNFNINLEINFIQNGVRHQFSNLLYLAITNRCKFEILMNLIKRGANFDPIDALNLAKWSKCNNVIINLLNKLKKTSDSIKKALPMISADIVNIISNYAYDQNNVEDKDCKIM